jgi:hypothetical protein
MYRLPSGNNRMPPHRHTYELLAAARRALMLPHPRGADQAIAEAFRVLFSALHELDRATLDANARHWVNEIARLIDTTGLDDPAGEGLWVVKARTLTEDDQLRLRNVVDDLAGWLRRSEE